MIYISVMLHVIYTKVSQSLFGVGYRFYYWDYYKDNASTEQLQPANNRYDHGGFDTIEMYIEAKYESIKHEVINNKFFPLSCGEFARAFIKAEKYMKATVVKNLKARIFEEDINVYTQYGLSHDDPITINHILGVILYTDCTELCTQFSRTFRKIRPFQTLISIKKNNSEFAIWSRYLRESVEIFGKTGDDFTMNDGKKVYTARGPFFCGMSRVMALPQFNIRLCAPTSTSTHIEVATRFGGDDGMLIRVNNTETKLHRKLHLFNCSWLSKHNGEDERLFFGGAYRIRIENIRNMKSRNIYESIVKALYYFHCMISGTECELSDCSDKDRQIILDLIYHRLGIDGFRNRYDKYTNDTFDSFINNQTQIVLDLFQIYFHFGVMEDLILTPFCEMDNFKEKINDEIIRLFKNMKELIIYTKDLSDHNLQLIPYHISIPHLMQSIQIYFKGNRLQIMIKASNMKWKDSWISFEYGKWQNTIHENTVYDNFKVEFESDDSGHLLKIEYSK